MNANPHPHPFRPLVSGVALVLLATGVLFAAAPGRSMDRVQRRTGSLRAPVGGAQRNGAFGVEAEGPDPAAEPASSIVEPATVLAAVSAPEAGVSSALAPDWHVSQQHPARIAALPPALSGLALRARPQGPTFGRPPPL